MFILEANFQKDYLEEKKKRATIGYELIRNSSMLILDEPKTGLDS